MRLSIIFLIVGIFVVNIMYLGFISILGFPLPVQPSYSSKGEEGVGTEKGDSEDGENDDSNDKSSSMEKSPLSLPLADDDNQDEEEEDSNDSNPPSSPSKENDEPPASFQNPRLVPPTVPLAAESDDNGMPTSSMQSSSPIPKDRLLPLQISDLCSYATGCATLRILMNQDYNITNNTNKDIIPKNIITIDFQRNNQSISSFTLNNSETRIINLLIDPGQYDIIANKTEGSTTISKMSADCSGIVKAVETKTCVIAT